MLRAAAIKGKVSIMAGKGARVYVIPSLVSWASYTDGIKRQCLEAKFTVYLWWRGICGHGLWNLFSLWWFVKSNFYANSKGLRVLTWRTVWVFAVGRIFGKLDSGQRHFRNFGVTKEAQCAVMRQFDVQTNKQAGSEEEWVWTAQGLCSNSVPRNLWSLEKTHYWLTC